MTAKSTLIGRLLHDSKMIYEDQLAAVQADSVKSGTTGAGMIDLALLVDGLQAGREQGITIDVAYRYFSTSTRLAAESFGEDAQHLADGQALVEALLPPLRPGVNVLVKGSRCMAMESIVAELVHHNYSSVRKIRQKAQGEIT